MNFIGKYCARAAAALSLLTLTIASAPAIDIMETMRLPEPRQFHGSAVLGSYLYVFGGNNGKAYVNVPLFAPIRDDGQLGQWKPTTPLPDLRNYIENSTLVLNDTVYVIGGSDDTTGVYHNTALYTRPNPDGTLQPWKKSGPYGAPGTAPAAFATPGYVHITGGKSSSTRISDEVWSAKVSPNGDLETWQLTGRLPKPLWFHQAGVVSGRVYIWGGLPTMERKPVADVISAEVLSSGLLGPWKVEKPLPTAFYGCPAAVAGPYLVSFTPRVTGGDPTPVVWFNYITQDGPTVWQSAPTTLPIKVFHAAATDYRRGNLYIPSGRQTRDAKTLDSRAFFFILARDARYDTKTHDDSKSVTAAAAARATSASGTRQQIAQYTFQADTSLPTSAVKGFHTIGEARALATGASPKPLLVYFTHDAPAPCQKQNEILRDPAFQQLTGDAVFAWVNIGDYPQFAQQLGVWRVPTWVIFDRKGYLRGKNDGIVTLPQLGGALASVQNM